MRVNTICKLALLSGVLWTCACTATGNGVDLMRQARELVHHYIGVDAEVDSGHKVAVQVGDFNGDGKKDLAVLFLPRTKPSAGDRLSVTKPWVYLEGTGIATDGYKMSLALFHGGSASTFEPADGRAYCLLDQSGALETPSFELLVTQKSDPDYAAQAGALPAVPAGDLIVLPTEAGIDTYVYWNGSEYALFEPEEMP